MIITVVGQHLVELPAELGTLHLDVVAVDEDRAAALQHVQQRTNDLLRELKRRGATPDSPVERHVVQAPQVWAEQRFDQNGQPSGSSHRASVAVRITFRNAAALSAFTAVWGESPEIQLGHVAWELTEATRTRHQDEVLGRAIDDARRRAAVMARAAGCGEPALRELADPGLLGGAASTSAESAPLVFAQARPAKADAIELAPERITLSAAVHARFEA
ncbi:SIMPL domain-containing protein [Luteococcus sp. H138]|uniref:SIMPL domain-containing protein n=1 Tax=unclassified Luteococcus TaxID=2639923 RepID=UPI00313C4089